MRISEYSMRIRHFEDKEQEIRARDNRRQQKTTTNLQLGFCLDHSSIVAFFLRLLQTFLIPFDFLRESE